MQINSTVAHLKGVVPQVRKPIASQTDFAAVRVSSDTTARSEINQAQGLQQPVDANTILQHWGTSNPLADLNTDGIVDGSDLTMALAMQQPNGQGNGPVSVETILQHWGTSNSAADLNADGTVDGSDLTIALSGVMPQSPPVQPSTEPNPSVPNPAVVHVAPTASPVSPAERAVDEIVGSVFKTFDADQDGTIRPEDLTVAPRLFKHFDADGTGSISRGELTKGLLEEFDRFAAARPDADPSTFSNRWLDAFAGMRRMPDYMAHQKLGELFAPQGVATQQSLPSILSAKA